jgi:hypothetical protein
MTIEFKTVYHWRLIDTCTGLLSKVPDQYNSETGVYVHVDDEYNSKEQAYEALRLLITEEIKWRYSGDDFKLLETLRATW